MTFPRGRFAVGAVATLLCALVIAGTVGGQTQEPEGNYGIGIPDVFLPKYLRFRAQQLNSGRPNVLRIRLGYVKGLSRSFTRMVGETAVDLETGAFEVSLNGLTAGVTYSVWLVDRTESGGIVPDTVFRLATVLAIGPSTLLKGVLGLDLPLGFSLDRVVVAPGVVWGAEALGAGDASRILWKLPGWRNQPAERLTTLPPHATFFHSLAMTDGNC